jgi:hypothetical protein
MNHEPLGRLTFGVPTKQYESLDYRCFFFTEIPPGRPTYLYEFRQQILYSSLRDTRRLCLTV